jgi:hypothetical protein
MRVAFVPECLLYPTFIPGAFNTIPPSLSGSLYVLLQGTRPGDLLQRSTQGEALSTN